MGTEFLTGVSSTVLQIFNVHTVYHCVRFPGRYWVLYVPCFSSSWGSSSAFYYAFQCSSSWCRFTWPWIWTYFIWTSTQIAALMNRTFYLKNEDWIQKNYRVISGFGIWCCIIRATLTLSQFENMDAVNTFLIWIWNSFVKMLNLRANTYVEKLPGRCLNIYIKFKSSWKLKSTFRPTWSDF